MINNCLNLFVIMKKLTYLLLLISFQFYGQGLKLTPEAEYNTFPKLPVEKFGFASNLPYQYSLEKHVPPVRYQEGGTCVGFASFYYGLSTMYNAKLNLTSSDEKYAHSFDPYHIYSIVFNGTKECNSGLTFQQGFSALYNIGAKKLFYPPFTNCETQWTNEKVESTLAYTMPYSINQWYRFDIEHPDFLNSIKNQINNNTPVIVGVSYVKSMQTFSSDNKFGVGDNGLWDPQSSEEIKGGHALCVIGYDDYKFGGAFRIVNSWGSQWGDNGYMWITYDKFKSFTKEAYCMELNENVKVLPPTVIRSSDYKRYRYTTDKNNYSFYEGQYLNDGINGYGIWTDKDKNAFYVGQFDDGEMNGFFLVLDQDGLYGANAVNGTLQDFEKLGFASDQTLMDTQLEAKKYFSNFGLPLSIRKANSTKKSSSQLSKDE